MEVQHLHIRRRFPHFVRRGDARASVWRGTFQPRENSGQYAVSISYERGGIPQVRVLNPALAATTPHLHNGGALCLYFPLDWQWHGTRLLAETIFPWSASWLYFYELWLETGDWLGPSAPHGASKVVDP
jgi:hypothetical protein